MKIAYVANARIPTEKAHGLQIMEMCRAFARNGHEVTLVVPKRRNVIKEDPFLYYDIEPCFEILRRGSATARARRSSSFREPECPDCEKS